MWTLLLLVHGRISFHPGEILQPPRHEVQQVLQLHTHEVSNPLGCTLSAIASSIEVAASWDFSCVCGLPLCWCWWFFIILKQKQASIFFCCQCKKARQTKSFCFRMVKNSQHQHKGKPHTHEKIQDTAISRAVAMIIFKGVNLSGAHCTGTFTVYRYIYSALYCTFRWTYRCIHRMSM